MGITEEVSLGESRSRRQFSPPKSGAVRRPILALPWDLHDSLEWVSAGRGMRFAISLEKISSQGHPHADALAPDEQTEFLQVKSE